MAAGEVVAFLGLIAPTGREGEKAGERSLRAPRAVKRAKALAELVQERLRIYLEEMRGLSLAERPGYVLRKVRSLGSTAIKPRAFKGAQRELSQLEVYHANLSALDAFQRRPLEGTLLAFEILETAEEKQRNSGSSINWQAFWQGSLEWHFLPGKDSGDMLAGPNAGAVAMRLTDRLRAAFERSATAHRQAEHVE